MMQGAYVHWMCQYSIQNKWQCYEETWPRSFPSKTTVEVLRLTCLGRGSNRASSVGGEHYRKGPFEHLSNMLFEICTQLPQCMWPSQMDRESKLECRLIGNKLLSFDCFYPNSTGKWSTLNIRHLQVRIFESCRGSPLWRDLTKVISILN